MEYYDLVGEIEGFLQKQNYNTNRIYTPLDLIFFYNSLLDFLLSIDLKIEIVKAKSLKGIGICLVDLSHAQNKIYLISCIYNNDTEDYKFYDFNLKSSFYSEKKVIINKKNIRCLLLGEL